MGFFVIFLHFCKPQTIPEPNIYLKAHTTRKQNGEQPQYISAATGVLIPVPWCWFFQRFHENRQNKNQRKKESLVMEETTTATEQIFGSQPPIALFLPS